MIAVLIIQRTKSASISGQLNDTASKAELANKTKTNAEERWNLNLNLLFLISIEISTLPAFFMKFTSFVIIGPL